MNSSTLLPIALPANLTAEVVDSLTGVAAIVMFGLVVIVYLVYSNWRKVAIARARERTRRDLAAYVAEGTIDPEHAVLLAGDDPDPEIDAIKRQMAQGWISPKKAKAMISIIHEERAARRPDPGTAKSAPVNT